MMRPMMLSRGMYPNTRLSITSGGASSALSASTQQLLGGILKDSSSSSSDTIWLPSMAATRRTYMAGVCHVCGVNVMVWEGGGMMDMTGVGAREDIEKAAGW